MEIYINWTPVKFYNWTKWSEIKFWFFTFKKFRYIKGAIIRFCGIYFQIMESNATDKLINFG